MRYVTIKKFSDLSGYTAKAVQRKIQDGKWRQDQMWRRAPDGRILIDLEEFEKWAESSQIR